MTRASRALLLSLNLGGLYAIRLFSKPGQGSKVFSSKHSTAWKYQILPPLPGFEGLLFLPFRPHPMRGDSRIRLGERKKWRHRRRRRESTIHRLIPSHISIAPENPYPRMITDIRARTNIGLPKCVQSQDCNGQSVVPTFLLFSLVSISLSSSQRDPFHIPSKQAGSFHLSLCGSPSIYTTSSCSEFFTFLPKHSCLVPRFGHQAGGFITATMLRGRRIH